MTPEVSTVDLQDKSDEQEPRRRTKRDAEVEIREIDDRVVPPSTGALIVDWGRADEERTREHAEQISETNPNETYQPEKTSVAHTQTQHEE